MEPSMDHSMVAMHLEPYGYVASSLEDWKQPASSSESWPQLRLSLGGHSEKDGHTYYTAECELSEARSSLQLAWQSQKRLAKLREELHDIVRNELGKDYPEVFALAPFAKRGGWHGTSDRLKTWLETLADCVNKGVAPPILVSQILLFFDAPAQSEHQASADVVREECSTATPSPVSVSGSQASPALDDISCEPELADHEVTCQARSVERSENAEADGYSCGEDVAICYLGAYGYESCPKLCDGPSSSPGKPVLRLDLDGHSEQEGHTYYSIQCNLSTLERLPTEKHVLCLDWKVQRRLGQLREELHDIVKDGLGKNYGEHFSSAPFARRGGVSGTTGRLQHWLETLASCINGDSMPPGLLAKVLQFLETPPPPKSSKGPASPQKMRCKVLPESEPQLQPAPEETPPAPAETSPAPEEALPSQLPTTQEGEGHCDAACSPMKPEPVEEAWELRHEICEDEDAISENPDQFSQAKRRNGYRKLRDWFSQLKARIGSRS